MERTWGWSTTTSRMPGKAIDEVVALCRAVGLAGLEGGESCFANCGMPELAQTGAALRAAGLAMQTFHLPFGAGDDIASFYETSRRATATKIRLWMERAAALGARIGILHPSTSRCSVDIEGLDPYMAALDKTFRELLPAAESLGMTLALENMLPGDAAGGRLGSRPEHFILFRQRFGHANLGFCLDTGHALVALRERAAEFFDAMGSELVAFHLQDTPGDRDSHLAPGHGRVDWDVVFQRMARLEYRGIACIEAAPFDFGPDYSATSWRQLVLWTDRLVAAALADAT